MPDPRLGEPFEYGTVTVQKCSVCGHLVEVGDEHTCCELCIAVKTRSENV